MGGFVMLCIKGTARKTYWAKLWVS